MVPVTQQQLAPAPQGHQQPVMDFTFRRPWLSSSAPKEALVSSGKRKQPLSQESHQDQAREKVRVVAPAETKRYEAQVEGLTEQVCDQDELLSNLNQREG